MIPWTIENIENLKQIVCCQKGVNKNDVLSNTRLREIVESRQLIAYFLYMKFEKKSLQKIGYEIGKDHATVLHCIKTVKRLKEVDNDYCIAFDGILKQVALLNIKKTRRKKLFLPCPAPPKRGILKRTLNRRMRVI